MIFILVSIFFGLIIIFKKPLSFITLSVIFCIYPLSGLYFRTPISRVFGVVYVIDIVIVILMVFSVYFLLTKRKFLDKSILTLMWIFFIIFILGLLKGLVLYGHSAAGMSRHYGGLLPLFFLVIYGLRVNNNISISIILKTMVYIGLIALLVSIIGYLKILISHGISPHRAFGNTHSLLIAYSFIAILFSKINNIKISRFIHRYSIVMIAILLFGLVLSASRSTWVSIIFALILFIPILKVKQNFKLLITISATGLLIFSLLFYNSSIRNSGLLEDIRERFSGISNPESETSASFRLVSWTYYFSRFLANPAMGEGIGNRLAYQFDNIFIDTEAHNLYIMILVQRGIIGTLPLLLIFLLVYIKTIKLKKIKYIDDKQYLLALVSCFSIIVTGGWLFFTADNSLIWIVLGIFVWVHNKILFENMRFKKQTRMII
jgi:O-antigen ligase